MKRFGILKKFWYDCVRHHLQTEYYEDVGMCTALSLTSNLGEGSIMDYSGLELYNMLASLDSIDLPTNTATMYERTTEYKKLKYTVLDMVKKSMTNTVNIEGRHIKNIQIIESNTHLNFIFTISHVDMLEVMPLLLYAMLRIVEHVCEQENVDRQKDLNIFINIGHSFIKPKYVGKAKYLISYE